MYLLKRVTFSILGAISAAGVINISLKKPQTTTSKKRKVSGDAVHMVSGWVITLTAHYLAYLCNVMDVLDKSNMKGHHLVIDNASIHSSVEFCDLLRVEDIDTLYLPPYSLLRNFWAKVKGWHKEKCTESGRSIE